MAFFRKEKLLSIFFSKIIGKLISGDKALICIFSESYISIIIFFIPLSFTLSSFFNARCVGILRLDHVTNINVSLN